MFIFLIIASHFLKSDYFDSFSVQYSKNKYVFALTGKTWALVKQYYPELISKLVTRGAIFARMSPDQKQQLVQELQSLGYYVGKCKQVQCRSGI